MLHEPQANTLAAVGARLHANAGVLHFEHQPPVNLLEADPDGTGPCMASGVAQGLLGNAIQVGRLVVIVELHRRRALKPTRNAMYLGGLPRQLRQCRHETFPIYWYLHHAAGQRAHALITQLDSPGHARGDLAGRGRVVAAQRFREALRQEPETGELLLSPVVQLLAYAALLQHRHVDDFLLQRLVLGHVAGHAHKQVAALDGIHTELNGKEAAILAAARDLVTAPDEPAVVRAG